MIAPANPRDNATGAPRRSISTRFGWLSGVLLLAAVVIVATHLAEGREVARLAREASPRWLLAGAALQALTYVCAAGVWQRTLAFLGTTARLSSLVPLGLAKLFTDQAVPSIGLSGTLLVVRGLERRGISRTDAVAAMLTGLAAYYFGYLVAIAGSIAVLGWEGELRPLTLLPLAAIGLFAAGVPLAMFVLRRTAVRTAAPWFDRWPGARDIAAALQESPPGTLFAPRLLVETSALQLAIFALDALTLDTAMRAVATPVAFPVVFAGFIMASVVSSLTWVPGGLGTFEGTCVAMLHVQGVGIESALAATLLLRGMTFWLPMIPGFALARREADTTRSRRD